MITITNMEKTAATETADHMNKILTDKTTELSEKHRQLCFTIIQPPSLEKNLPIPANIFFILETERSCL